MARKATANQKEAAKKLGVNITRKVGGKRVEKSAEQLKKDTENAKERAKKKKLAAKRKAASTRQIGSTTRGVDIGVKAKPAGKRKSTKTSVLEYKVRDPKTGKIVIKKVRRRNANQTGKVSGGTTYTERRANRSDKGKFI